MLLPFQKSKVESTPIHTKRTQKCADTVCDLIANHMRLHRDLQQLGLKICKTHYFILPCIGGVVTAHYTQGQKYCCALPTKTAESEEKIDTFHPFRQ